MCKPRAPTPHLGCNTLPQRSSLPRVKVHILTVPLKTHAVRDSTIALTRRLLELLPHSFPSNHTTQSGPPPQGPITCCSFLLEDSFPSFCKAQASLPSSLHAKDNAQSHSWTFYEFHILSHPTPFLCLIFLFFPLNTSSGTHISTSPSSFCCGFSSRTDVPQGRTSYCIPSALNSDWPKAAAQSSIG